jgi:type IV secretory pathway VirJ component
VIKLRVLLLFALALSVFAVGFPATAEDDLVGIFDLPSARTARAIALIYSGDGGWQDLDKTIGEWMAAKDIHVIGVSTIKAFWESREPTQVAADIKALIAEADPSGALPVMLIGYSFGANILPFAWPKLEPETRDRVRLIALLVPEQQTAFHVSVVGWLGIETGSHSVPDAMKALPPARVLCVFGEGEADKTPCTEATLPGMELSHTSGGHHFDRNYPKLGQTILNAFDARVAGEAKDLPVAE